MRETTRNILQKRTRAIVSVLLAGALVMPAIPLAGVAPAFADALSGQPLSSEASSGSVAAGVSSVGSGDRISRDMPLDGSVVNAQGQIISAELAEELGLASTANAATDGLGTSPDQGTIQIPRTEEEKQAILDDYLEQGVITEADLSNDDLVETLTGEYLADLEHAFTGDHEEETCGNCLEEAERIEQEVRERQAESERETEEMLAQYDGPTYEEVVASEQRAEEAALAELDFDPALTNEDMVVSQPRAQDAVARASHMLVASLLSSDTAASLAASSPSSQVDSTDYSTDVVLKDVKSVTAYFSGDTSAYEALDRMYVGGYVDYSTGYYVALVESYQMPAFFGQIVSVRLDDDGDCYFRIKFPTPTGEEQKYVELYYGKRQKYLTGSWSSYADQKSAQVNDSTVLAELASIAGYDPSRDTAYLNAYKLAPFASHEDIVRSGNAVPLSSPIATKTISESWPAHKDDGMKVSLMEGDEENLVRNTVCFTDGTSQTYEMEYLGSSGLSASYLVGDTGMLYQPDFWVIGGSEAKQGVDHIASFLRTKTWNNWFGAYCSSNSASKNLKFHRSLREYFDVTIKDKAEEVAANLVSNIPTWNVFAASTYTWKAIMHEAETAKPDEQFDYDHQEVKFFNIMFFYTYWERFLGFDAGGSPEVGAQKNSNAFLVMAFRGDVIRKGLSILSFTYAIRYAGMYTFTLVSKVSSAVMPVSFSSVTGINNSVTFAEVIVKRTTGYTDMADWFADYMSSIAFYHEYKPPEVEGVSDNDQLTWRGWDQAKRNPDLLLLWLTLPPGTQYFASTSMIIATGPTGLYSKDVELDDAWRTYFKTRLDNVFNYAAQYSATVASIVGTSRPNSFCVITYDQRRSKYDSGVSNLECEGYTSRVLSQDPYHKHFTDVSAVYLNSTQGAAAMTINASNTLKRIHFGVYTALGCAWSYYWSHEMAHAIDNTVFLNGDRRGGNNTEDYTDGLLTQSHGSMSSIMNFTYDYDPSADILSNLTRERVYYKENLDDFYHKLYDTIDVLDYAALQAFLRLDKDQQNAVASQVWFTGHNGTSALDSGATATALYSRTQILNGYDGTVDTMPVNASVFNDGSKKFETVEEVYDNQIFLRPGISNTSGLTWLWANYVADDQRGLWWFPIHCNSNRPDSRSYKLQMYRMLGSGGFDAWSNFGRSGGNDLTKLQQITEHDSYKEWQLAKWEAIEQDKSSLGYIAFDELVNKFESALVADADKADRNLTQMHNLRVRMLYLMKRITNDFRYGIYENTTPVTFIRNAQDLLAIADDPMGNYALANDIDVSGIDIGERTTLMDIVFFGKLDGQGHKIYSSDNEIVPTLFTGAKTAYVKNLMIEGVTIQSVAVSVVNCELENVSYAIFERDIESVDDFVGIGNDLKLGVSTFHIKADLDFTAWSEANAALDETERAGVVVAQLVSGTAEDPKTFNGNGHKITGLDGASLFDRMCFAKLSELEIEDSQNHQSTTTAVYVSLVARNTYHCEFSDIYLNNVSLQGKTSMGFLSANDGFINAAGKDVRSGGGSTFRRIQVHNGDMVSGDNEATNVCYAGFIVGRICYSSLEDVYAEGAIRLFGTASGGLVGALHRGGTLNRCVSNVDTIRAKSGTKIAVFIGEFESPNYNAELTSVTNCFALGKASTKTGLNEDPNASSRFTNLTAPAAAAINDCYELLDHRAGIALSGAAVPGLHGARTTCFPWGYDADGVRAGYATVNLRSNADLFRERGFSEDVWEFDPTIQVGYPVLRFLGDRDTFYDYDLDITVDFAEEVLRITGSNVSFTNVRIHNLPYYVSQQGSDSYSPYKPGMWYSVSYGSTPARLKSMTDEPGIVDLSRIISQGQTVDPYGQPTDGFINSEVEEKGTRTVTLRQEMSVSGKAYDFEKSVEIPPRLENTYASHIKGIGAGSNGVGAIRVVSAGASGAPVLEYREATDEGEQENEWMPLASASTAVEAGTYEVRIAATESSFASFPSTVVVDEFDPNSIRFPLTLDPQGGDWAADFTAPDTYNSEESTILPGANSIARPGYSFTGWYTSADADGAAVTEIPSGNTMPIVLYAGWKADTYAVSLNTNGGVFANASDDVTQYMHGTAVSLPTPTRLGHEFAGWYASADFSGEPVSEIPADAFGAKQFFAKWTPNTYNVTLNPEGGEFVPDPEEPDGGEEGDDDGSEGEGPDSPDGSEGSGDGNDDSAPSIQVTSRTKGAFTYTFGIGAPLPDATKIAREGYEFGGWYDNALCAGSAVPFISATDTGDKQFWAKWIPHSYSVVLMKNQGTLKPGEHDVTRYEYGTGAVLPDLVRPGFRFDGWYADPDFADQPVFAIDGHDTGDKLFWAKWTSLTFDITYELGFDAAGNPAPETIDLSAYETFVGDQTLVLPGPDIMVWEDRVFAGWYDNPAFAGSPIIELTADRVESDMTLYAKWVGEASVIFYHTNGGTFDPEPKTIYEVGVDGFKRGDTIDLPAEPQISRMGYRFEGWYADETLEGAAIDKVILDAPSVVLYAKWSVVEYRIRYELDGGSWVSGFTAPDRYTIETEDVVLPGASDIYREDFAFTEWREGSTSGSSVTVIGSGSTGDKVLYATWKSVQVELPALEIVSLSLSGLSTVSLAWDENDYAQIRVSRSHVPTSPADFTLIVPDGVTYVVNEHQVTTPFWALETVKGARDASESKVWDITLASVVDPSYTRTYTLEIVPIDDDEGDGNEPPTGGDDGDDDEPPVGGGDDDEPPIGGGDDGTKPPTGDGDGDDDTKPPAGDGDGDDPDDDDGPDSNEPGVTPGIPIAGGDGSGGDSGTGNGSGSGLVGGSHSGASAGTSSGGSNGGGSGSSDPDSVNASGVLSSSGKLATTGDGSALVFGAFVGIGLAAFVLAVIARRRMHGQRRAGADDQA